MSIVVVCRIIPVEARENADTLARVEGSNPVSDTASGQDTTGVGRERSRSSEGKLGNLGEPAISLCTDPEDEGYRVTKSPGVEGRASDQQRAVRNTKRGSGQGIGKRAHAKRPKRERRQS